MIGCSIQRPERPYTTQLHIIPDSFSLEEVYKAIIGGRLDGYQLPGNLAALTFEPDELIGQKEAFQLATFIDASTARTYSVAEELAFQYGHAVIGYRPVDWRSFIMTSVNISCEKCSQNASNTGAGQLLRIPIPVMHIDDSDLRPIIIITRCALSNGNHHLAIPAAQAIANFSVGSPKLANGIITNALKSLGNLIGFNSPHLGS